MPAAVTTVYAHTYSASRSELKVEDGLSRLTIRMPIFELDHLPQSGRQLANYFLVAGTPPVAQSCNQEGDSWVCKATFVATPGLIECRLAEVTVPQHVHSMQYEGQTLVFTSAATALSVKATPPLAPFVWFALAAVVALMWLIRSLRSRRKISDPG
jgi:hypothetical protein